MLEGRDYADGEAIVVAEKGFDPAKAVKGDSEKLAEAAGESLSLAADAARGTDNETHEVMAERADASNASKYTVSIVRSDRLGTAELIEKLYTNPKVISAEPNYLTQTAEAYAVEGEDKGASGEESAEGAGSPQEDAEGEGSSQGDTEAAKDEEAAPENETVKLTAPKLRTNQSYPEFGKHDPEVGDLSSAQWYLGDGGGSNTLEGDGAQGVGMDLPGYNGDGGGSPNSSPDATIAVVDSGMDVTHPDLEDQFYTFSPEQQAKYGCGEHGLNASVEPGSDKIGDLTDVVDHGTHVTGIMGAAWDGKGTAGVANGAKLVGVRLSSDNGMQSAEGNVRAFNFLINCAQEINLKSANCSWGSDTGFIEFTYTILVNELGRHGVVTVFAAGNNNLDMDQKIETSSYIDSPYLLSVDAMNPAGKKAGYSNYGQTQTDVFAPGSDIMSTVPAKIVEKSYGGDEEPRVYNHLHPEGGQAAELLTKAEDFQNVKVYSENPITNTEARPVDFEIANTGTNDHASMKIDRDVFVSPGGDWNSGDSVYLKVPAGDLANSNADIELISLRDAINFEMTSVICKVFGFAADTDDGVKMATLQNDPDGYLNAASGRGSDSGWGTATANVGYMLSNDNAQSINIDNEGYITLWVGVYEERGDGKKADAVYIDDITLGGSNAHAGAHAVFNGTSMAAPTVTAALAVVSKDEPANSNYEVGEGEGTLGMQALKRSARLRAATEHTDYFKEL